MVYGNSEVLGFEVSMHSGLSPLLCAIVTEEIFREFRVALSYDLLVIVQRGRSN